MNAPQAAALRRPSPRGGGETLGAALRLLMVLVTLMTAFELMVVVSVTNAVTAGGEC